MKPRECNSLVTAMLALAALLCFVPARAFAQPAPPPPSQSLYVSSGCTGRIDQFAADGSYSLFGSGVMGVNCPQALAFDNAGNLYVADIGVGGIDRFTPGNAPSVFVSFVAAGLNYTNSGGSNGVFSTGAIAFDNSGILTMSCTSQSANYQGGNMWGLSTSGNVYQFDSGGNLITNSVYPIAGLSNPGGMAFDTSGNLFVADSGSIYEFAPDGSTPTTVVTGLDSLSGLAIDDSGDLFVGDIGGDLQGTVGSIFEFTPNGDGTFGQSTFATGLDTPTGLAFDSAGDLFVGDSGGFQPANGAGSIYEFSANGTSRVFASGLNAPSYLAFGPSGFDGSAPAPLGGFLPGPTVAPEPSVLAAQVALGGLLLGGSLLLRRYRGRVIV